MTGNSEEDQVTKLEEELEFEKSELLTVPPNCGGIEVSEPLEMEEEMFVEVFK